MHVLRILLLVMTAGVLAFILYQAITRQIPREAFWTAIAIACGFSLESDLSLVRSTGQTTSSYREYATCRCGRKSTRGR